MQSSVRPQKKVDLPRNSALSNPNFLSIWTREMCLYPSQVNVKVYIISEQVDQPQ